MSFLINLFWIIFGTFLIFTGIVVVMAALSKEKLVKRRHLWWIIPLSLLIAIILQMGLG